MTTTAPGMARDKTETLGHLIKSLERFAAIDELGTRYPDRGDSIPEALKAVVGRAVSELKPFYEEASTFYAAEATKGITLANGLVLLVGERYDLTITRESAYRTRKPRRLVGWTLMPRTRDNLFFKSPSGLMTKNFRLTDGALNDWGTAVTIEPA